MDQILRRDKAQTTTRTGKALRLQSAGAATASTYDDEWILPDDFLAQEQLAISDNEDAIALLELEVAEVKETSFKRLYKNKNSAFSFTPDVDEHIDHITFMKVSGSPTIKIGTTLGGDDLLETRLIDDNYRGLESTIYPKTGQVIYLGIVSGIVHIAVYSRINVMEL